MEYDVRGDAVETFEVGGGVRIFWRGVREKGGSSEPPEPPLVTGLSNDNMVSNTHAILLQNTYGNNVSKHRDLLVATMF